MSTENTLPTEALSDQVEVTDQIVEEGGGSEIEASTAEVGDAPISEPVAEQVYEEIIVPEDQYDEEGFPILPVDALEVFEAIGMPKDAAEQIITTAKETIRSFRAQVDAGDELDEESKGLMKSAEETLKMYWKSYNDIKGNMPSRDEMINFVSDLFDTEYFKQFAKREDLRKFGSYVGPLVATMEKNKKRMEETGDLMVFFSPEKYIENIKDYSYLIRKLYQTQGVNGQASKSVMDRSYFLPIMVLSAIIKTKETGSDAIELPGIKKMLEEMDAKDSVGVSRLLLIYDKIDRIVKKLVDDLNTNSVTKIKNVIGAYVSAAMEDRDINRKKIGDEKRSFWISIIRGRITEFIAISQKFISEGTFDEVEGNKEAAIRDLAISYLAMLVQNITVLPLMVEYWKFAGHIRETSSDKNGAGEECIRYYVGQISYWNWVLLNFTGSGDEDINKFYDESKADKVEIFKVHKSFYGLDHKEIRSEFFAVFENAIDVIDALFKAIDKYESKEA